MLRFCLTISVISLCVLARGSSAPGQTLDTSLKFGFQNTADESAHSVSTSSGSLVGGAFKLGQSSRVVAPGQDVYFNIAVDPVAQNYITVRFFSDKLTSNVSVPGRTLVGNSTGGVINWGQVDDSSSAGMLEDHWHYSTIPLPKSMTLGQSTVRLSLYGLDNDANWNMTPPSADANAANTRSIYGVFSHTNPRFQPPDAPNNGTIVAPYDYGNFTKLTPTQVASFRSTLVGLANATTTTVRNKQKITAGSDPSLLGGFDVVTNAGSVDANLDATHVAQQNTDNFGPSRGAVILARAYAMQGGAYYQDANTLQRVAWGLDYVRRAQGATGGFVDVWNPVQWTGGGTAANPNRTDASGTLEGISHQEYAKAFLLTHNAMESAGLLDQLIDDDNKSSTPMVTRRQAYTDLFREIVDFHSGVFGGYAPAGRANLPRDYGHAPNQDLYQVGGLAWATEALEALDNDAFVAGDPTASHALAQATLKTRAFQAAGLTKSPYNDSWWFSPLGLPLEDGGLKSGGYSSDYGQRESEDIWDISQFIDNAADRAALVDRAADAATLWQHFWYPIYNAGGTLDTRIEGAINKRNSKINGSDQWFPAQFAALSANGIEDPAVIRMLQLAYMNGELHIDAPRSGHFWQDSVWMMDQVDELTTLLTDLPSTVDQPVGEQRLPFEAGQPDFAWIDSFGGAVAIRHDNDFIYMSLNWKHTASGSNPIPNNIVRIHEITPQDGRVVTAIMENPTGQWGDLYRVLYGDYLVGVNADDATSFTLTVPTANGLIPDLVSGSLLAVTGGSLLLAPGQSVVLLLDELTPLIDNADFNDDGLVDGGDFLLWQRHAGLAGVGPYGPGDANGDGAVNGLDLGIWRAQFGTTPLAAAATVVPEPTSLTAALLGGLTVAIGSQVARRQRRQMPK